MPLRHLIVLIANAHHLAAIKLQLPHLLNGNIHNAIDAFDPVPLKDVTPSDIRAGS